MVALDLPGFGESPPLPPGESYDVPGSMDRLADAFAEHLGLLAGSTAGLAASAA